MTTIQACSALLPDGWHNDVSVEIDNHGHIANVTPQHPDTSADIHFAYLLPAPVNAHSHAFQY
ncbi:MAG: formimidoylglutamate deiminase, partial [Candidatus Puniceispirillum sp.]